MALAEAGLPTPLGGPREEELLKRLKSLAHVDDRERHDAYLHWLSDDAPAYAETDGAQRRWAEMLFFSLSGHVRMSRVVVDNEPIHTDVTGLSSCASTTPDGACAYSTPLAPTYWCKLYQSSRASKSFLRVKSR